MGRKELARLDIGAEIRKGKEKERGRQGDKIPQMDNSDGDATQRVEAVFSI